jgi:hypothetical protein
MLAAGMLGISAMAAQNALVRIALVDAPSTAVLTTDIALLTSDFGEILLGRDADRIAKVRHRVKKTWPAVRFSSPLRSRRLAREQNQSALVLPVGFGFIARALAMCCKWCTDKT